MNPTAAAGGGSLTGGNLGSNMDSLAALQQTFQQNNMISMKMAGLQQEQKVIDNAFAAVFEGINNMAT